jgi:hypothetical protein
MPRTRRHYVCALAECGKPFTAVDPRAQYCCAGCRNKAFRRARESTITCEGCGGEFRTRRTDQRFCSKDCRVGSQTYARARKTAIRCADCGSVLEPGEAEVCDGCTASTRH